MRSTTSSPQAPNCFCRVGPTDTPKTHKTLPQDPKYFHQIQITFTRSKIFYETNPTGTPGFKIFSPNESNGHPKISYDVKYPQDPKHLQQPIASIELRRDLDALTQEYEKCYPQACQRPAPPFPFASIVLRRQSRIQVRSLCFVLLIR